MASKNAAILILLSLLSSLAVMPGECAAVATAAAATPMHFPDAGEGGDRGLGGGGRGGGFARVQVGNAHSIWLIRKLARRSLADLFSRAKYRGKECRRKKPP